MPTVTCKCREVYFASDDHIGKLIQCRKCGRKVKIVPDKKSQREPKPERTREPRAAKSRARDKRPIQPGEPYYEKYERLDAATKKRLLIVLGVLVAVTGLMAVQVYVSLRRTPTVVVPVDAGGDPGQTSLRLLPSSAGRPA